MSAFAVGNRVRNRVGATGEVVAVSPGWATVEYDGQQIQHVVQTKYLNLVDSIDHPDHYKWLPVEAIDITEHFNFTMGNALKYIIRADHKGNPIEDLKKARWYIDREIQRREQLQS